MDLNFDNKDEKHYYSLSEINKLKRDLSCENFETKDNKNNSMTIEKKVYDIKELDKEEEKIKIPKNENENEYKIEEKLDNSNEHKHSNDDNDNEANNKKSLNSSFSEVLQKIKNNNDNKSINIEKEKQENPKEEKIEDLIPLWYRCLNKDHMEKYITLDRKKKNLICKNCYNSGALETNLELNQEFIESYLKDQEHLII